MAMNYNLIVDGNGDVIQENDKVLVQQISDNQLIYIDKSELSGNTCNTSSDVIEASERERVPWMRNEILQLIVLYKKYQNKIKSTTVKNNKIWQIIGDAFDTSEPPSKKQKNKLQKQLHKHEENLKLKEEAKEQRHKERIQKQDEAMDVLKSIAESFAKIVEKQ